MGVGNVWNRALVYFGIAEEDEYWDDDYSAETSLERSYSERPNVRRLHRPRQKQEEFDDWSESEQPPSKAPASSGRRQGRAQLEAVAATVPGAQKVHLVIPRGFNDAQSIADRFKDSVPVILNLQSADPEQSRPYFRELALLAGEHGLSELSMGTTQDYRVGAEEGATLVRVGSVLFGR